MKLNPFSFVLVILVFISAFHNASFAQEYSHFEVYQKMNPGIFRIFETFLKSISIEDKTASLCLQKASDQIKCLECTINVNDSSSAKAFEQYTCADTKPDQTAVTRVFKFSPGISSPSHQSGRVEIHKDSNPSVTVSYRKTP